MAAKIRSEDELFQFYCFVIFKAYKNYFRPFYLDKAIFNFNHSIQIQIDSYQYNLVGKTIFVSTLLWLAVW